MARWTGIPVNRMLQDEIRKLSEAETELNKEVIGQEEAIKAISNALRRSRLALMKKKTNRLLSLCWANWCW